MDLDFRELIELVNRTGVLAIGREAVELEAGRWCIFECHVRVGLVNMKLFLLYLMPGLSAREELARAVKALRGRLRESATGQIVYADSLVENKRFPSLTYPEASDSIPRQGMRAFFVSLADQQLTVYLASLRGLDMHDYVEPELVTLANGTAARRVRVKDLIRGHDAENRATPELNVLVAEPGQGKTYLCSYLAQITALKGRIPLLVSSNQWQTMAPGDLQSIFKTILNALQHFNAPIPWTEGAEETFVKVAQKSGSFTLIFDGFDEYVLRRSGNVSAPEVLQSFRDLAVSTSSQILLTSRTAFWEAAGAEVFATFKEDIGLRASVFAIEPFDRKHALKYFERRLDGREDAVNAALSVFDKLKTARSGSGMSLVGRGFLLSLIADLSSRLETAHVEMSDNPVEKPLDWVCESFCAREDLRLGLGIPARKQLKLFEELAEATAVEAGASTDTFALLLQTVCDFDVEQAAIVLGTDGARAGKLAYHPLLKQRKDHRWVFSENQLYYLFVARRVLSLLAQRRHTVLGNFLDRIRDLRQLHFEIAGFLLYLLAPSTKGFEPFKAVVVELIDIEADDGRSPACKSSIAASLAILAVNEELPRGADKLERRQLFQRIIGGPISRLHFSDTLTNFNFRGVEFLRCRFENLTFVRCEFDKSTRFVGCRFHGVASLGSKRLGEAVFSPDCTMDPEFRRLLALDAAGAGASRYTVDDLRADVELALVTLLPSETRPPAPITEEELLRGRIGGSPLRNQIIAALRRDILRDDAEAPIKGSMRLSNTALPAVLFHRANGVFTGPLIELWERLQTDFDARRSRADIT